MATLRNAILEARQALTDYADLTQLVPEGQITFGNSPQKDVMPRIVIEVAGVDYEPTFYNDREQKIYIINYAVFSTQVDQCTQILDELRLALDAYTSQQFETRITDETFSATVDGVLVGVVEATFTNS